MKNKKQQQNDNTSSGRAPVKRTLARQIHRWKQILHLSETVPELKEQALRLTYGDERMAAGKEKLEKLERLTAEQKTALAHQASMVEDFNKKFKIADKTAVRLVDVARTTFADDPGAQVLLKLKGRRSKVLAQWMDDNMFFYDRLINDAQLFEQISEWGITKKDLENAKEQLTEVDKADIMKKHAIADKQQATEKRNKSYKDFSDWINLFLELMRAVLKDEPHLKKLLKQRSDY